MTVKEIKNLFFYCDDCKITKLLSNVFEGTLPDGWSVTFQYSSIDGYGSFLKDFGKAVHYCEKCSEKREIKEVFK